MTHQLDIMDELLIDPLPAAVKLNVVKEKVNTGLLMKPHRCISGRLLL